MEARSPEYLTVAEAAALLRVSRKTIEAAARRGELPSECVGRQRRFLRRALDAHFSRYRAAGTDPAASWPDMRNARGGKSHVSAHGHGGGGRGSGDGNHRTDSGESARRRKANGAKKGFLRAALRASEAEVTA